MRDGVGSLLRPQSCTIVVMEDLQNIRKNLTLDTLHFLTSINNGRQQGQDKESGGKP